MNRIYKTKSTHNFSRNMHYQKKIMTTIDFWPRHAVAHLWTVGNKYGRQEVRFWFVYSCLEAVLTHLKLD